MFTAIIKFVQLDRPGFCVAKTYKKEKMFTSFLENKGFEI
jgi:hypothetical protein